MPRRQAILETLLIFAVFCVQGLARAGGQRAVLPGQGDSLLESAMGLGRLFPANARHAYHVLFHRRLVVAAAKADRAGLDAAFGHLGTFGLVVAAARAAVVPRTWASVLTATLFVFLLQHFNMAGEWVVGGVEGKGFSFALVFFALAAMVEGCWNRMWLLLGLATAFHALVGGWAAVAASAVWLGSNPNARSKLVSVDCTADSTHPRLAGHPVRRF